MKTIILFNEYYMWSAVSKNTILKYNGKSYKFEKTHTMSRENKTLYMFFKPMDKKNKTLLVLLRSLPLPGSPLTLILFPLLLSALSGSEQGPATVAAVLPAHALLP